MYIFNWNLFENLPQITGTSITTFGEKYDVKYTTWKRWAEKRSISVYDLVALLNRLHISMAHFLLSDTENPEMRLNILYDPSPDTWKPIEWHNERIGQLYGNGGKAIAPSYYALGKKIGMVHPQKLQRWEANPETMRVYDLVDMLNKLKLDARILIDDPNREILLPKDFVDTPVMIPKFVADADKSVAQMKNEMDQQGNIIKSQAKQIARLERENQALRKMKGVGDAKVSSGMMLGESTPNYATPFSERGYTFHSELWKSLFGLFGMTAREFCDRFKVNPCHIGTGANIKLSKLIEVCNTLHISICHFFPPKAEPLVVHDRGYYEISPRLFVPIEDCTENLKYLFGRYSVVGYALEELMQVGIGDKGRIKILNNKTMMVMTLADICNRFNIPPYAFVKDDNKKNRPPFSVSQNETLLMNAIDMMKEIEKLRATVRKLREKKELGG